MINFRDSQEMKALGLILLAGAVSVGSVLYGSMNASKVSLITEEEVQIELLKNEIIELQSVIDKQIIPSKNDISKLGFHSTEELTRFINSASLTYKKAGFAVSSDVGRFRRVDGPLNAYIVNTKFTISNVGDISDSFGRFHKATLKALGDNSYYTIIKMKSKNNGLDTVFMNVETPSLVGHR